MDFINSLNINDWIFMYWVCGIAVNWLVDNWEFKIKIVIANLIIVCMAWVISEKVIAIYPQSVMGKILYVLISIIVSFAPVDTFKFITSTGWEALKTWIRNIINKLVNKTPKGIEEKNDETKNIGS